MKILLLTTIMALAVCANAADPQVPSNPPADAPINGRSKQLKFDDSVVEGMNQNTKDSLESLEKRNASDRSHLYQKRAEFKNEIQRFPAELGYSP
jgi:hypothetical protein